MTLNSRLVSCALLAYVVFLPVRAIGQPAARDGRMRRYTGIPGWLGASLMVPFAERRLGLAIDDVKPVDHIAKLTCPVFILSGDRDDRTTLEDTRRLYEAARQPKELWMVPEASHEDLDRHDGYREKVSAFLQRYLH
jgi:fermentation-respiration switch protein FrsA (DUF1100 family)